MQTVKQLRQHNIPALDRIKATWPGMGPSVTTGTELRTRSIMYEFRYGTPYRSTEVV